MLQTFTPNLKKLLIPLLMQCVLAVAFVLQSNAQTQVFPVETMGNVDIDGGNPVSIEAHDNVGFVNSAALHFEGTGFVNNVVLSPSNYLGASGGNTVQLERATFFQISNIKTTGFKDVSLRFGHIRTSPALISDAGFSIEYNANTGSGWVKLVSFTPSFPGWGYASLTDSKYILPSVDNLSIRFVRDNSDGSGVRLDDVQLQGVPEDGISSFTPDKGGIGTQITIKGSGLQNVKTYAYLYEPIAGAYTPLKVISTATDGTQVVVEVIQKPSEPSRQQQIMVYNDNFSAEYKSSGLFLFQGPEITSLDPATDKMGATIKINGTRLAVNDEVPSVNFTKVGGGTTSATVTGATATQLQVTVPADAATGPIIVKTSEGAAASGTFTVLAPSLTATGTLVGFNSAVGVASATQSYILSGTNLSGGVNVVAPTHFQVSLSAGSGFSNSIFVPLGADGNSVNQTVYVRYLPASTGAHSGTVTHTSSGLSVTKSVSGTAVAPITITSLSPDPVAGAKITTPVIIEGTRFTAAGSEVPAVRFTAVGGGRTAPATINFLSATRVEVVIPSNAATGSITVTTTEGTATSGSFTVLRPVVTITQSLTTFTTVAGTTSAVQEYTVSGTNLVTDLVIAAPALFEVSDDEYDFYANSITIPSSWIEGSSMSFYVRYKPTAVGNNSGNLVHTTEGTVESFGITGTAVQPLGITSLSQTSGRVGATVQINGTRLNEGGNPTVMFGGGVRATVTSATATAVVVTVPAGAQTGAITLTTTEGTATSGTFTVLQPGIAVSGTLTTFYTEVNKASAHQSYTISGSNLSQSVTVTAPEHFQVSLTTAENGFGSTVLVPQTNAATGSLSSTTVYVRYLPANEGTHSGTSVRNATAGVSDVLVAVQGEAILPQGSLPVELVSFNYVQQQDGVLLNWKTATEKDNSHFEIEMANDPKTGFVRVGSVDSKVVNSATLTQYQYKHSFTSTGGTRYYRLKQVDLDGTFEYSNVVAVETKAAQAVETVTVAPNPLNYNSKVFFSALSEGKAVLRLHSLEGKQVYTKEAVIRKGDNEIQLPVYDLLAKGAYILTVELNGTLHKVKVLKQ